MLRYSRTSAGGSITRRLLEARHVRAWRRVMWPGISVMQNEGRINLPSLTGAALEILASLALELSIDARHDS